jgi:anti-sigma factor RsiW
VSARENNGSGRRALPGATDSHEGFRELCALSTTGELSEEEWTSLKQHLASCGACRELIKQYEEVVASVVPAMAPESSLSPEDESRPDAWSIERAEQRLMATLADEPKYRPTDSSSPRGQWHFSRYAAAAAILIAAGVTGYLAGHWPSRGTEQSAGHGASSTRGTLAPPVQPPSPAAQPQHDLGKTEQIERASSQIRLEQEQVAHLEDQLNGASKELARQDAILKRSLEERNELGRELAQAQQRQQSLESKLSNTGDQLSQETAEMLGLKTRIEDLNRTLADKDTEIAEEQQLLARDQDIRNLIGARNLYIAEIYDVGKSGDTQKPFGRIFYTKDKSLIFYGYDLDQQRGVKKDSSFQAWGRRGSEGKPDVSLGLFYEEDSGNKRWVLKFTDPSLLEQLDAVFITIEPTGGSRKPTGKPLLFTYLRIDPNHP